MAGTYRQVSVFGEIAIEMRARWVKLTDLYDRHPTWGAVLAGAGLLLGLTAAHAALGFTSALRPLYVLPIWLATRMGGRVSGIVLVVFCTLVGTLSEWQIGHNPDETIGANLIIRFFALGFLMLLIAQVEQALSKHQRMALKDPLTGLLNRNALREFAEHAFHRAMLRQQPITVVVIDCDGFKLLNDTFGHQTGDRVLLLLAEALEKGTRQTDLVARTGGDEFAVVLQNTDLHEARQIMRRIDESFVAATLAAGHVAGISIGFGTSAGEVNELEAVLETADRSMYRHKQRKKTAASLR